MEYMIAYLLRGRAASAHQKLVRRLAKQFNEPYLVNRKRPSHITLKYEFSTEDIMPVENILREVANRNQQSKISVTRYITFHKVCICWKVDFSRAAMATFKDLRTQLKRIPYVQWSKEDSIEGKFHIALVYALNNGNLRKIKNYLEPRPNLEMPFDQIALLKRPRKYWKVHEIFRLSP
jgi:hypothetical protein